MQHTPGTERASTAPTPQQIDDAAGLAAYHSRTIHRADAALDFVVALALAAFGAWALVQYLTPCESAAHLCSLGAVLARVWPRTLRTPRDPAFTHQPTELDASWSPVPGYTEPERRWPGTPLDSALHAAHDIGERTGYTAGLRWGMVCGLCLGLPAGLLAAMVMVQLGMQL